MSNIEILFPDHERVVHELDAKIRLADTEGDVVLQKFCALIEGTLKTLLQSETHGTGLTAASIETREEAELTYGVGSYTRGHILRFLDLGTGIYRTGRMIVIMPVAKKALHWISKETGDSVFASYCIQKGIIPFEFTTRSVNSHLSDLDELIREAVEKT